MIHKTMILIAILLITVIGCEISPENIPENELHDNIPPTEEPPLSDTVDKDYCKVDEDCICRGIDVKTGDCYLGNKEYYESNVDSSKTCPDFCNGIAGNLVTKCIENKCEQVVNEETSKPKLQDQECALDTDCQIGGCSGQLCGKAGKRMLSTCEYRLEYGCYKLTSCGCVNGECSWKESEEFKQCLEGKQGSGKAIE